MLIINLENIHIPSKYEILFCEVQRKWLGQKKVDFIYFTISEAN